MWFFDEELHIFSISWHTELFWNSEIWAVLAFFSDFRAGGAGDGAEGANGPGGWRRLSRTGNESFESQDSINKNKPEEKVVTITTISFPVY